MRALDFPGRPAALLLGVLVSLAGCVSSSGLTPQGRTLAANDLKAGQTLQGTPLSPSRWPSQNWWTALGDPQLDSLIQEALNGTPDLQIAQARARQATAAMQSADADQLPTVKASGSYAGLRIPTSIIPAPTGAHRRPLLRGEVPVGELQL